MLLARPQKARTSLVSLVESTTQRSLFALPLGILNCPINHFEFWQMDFIQLSPSRGYKYVLVMISMFSHRTKAFPYRQATATCEAKFLSEKIMPTWRISFQLYSNQGPILQASVCCLAGLTTPSLCLPRSILRFSQTH